MNPGELLLDERIAAGGGGGAAEARAQGGDAQSRYASGAAPVLIRLYPSGDDRSGRGPVLFPVRAGVVGPLFDEPGGVRSRRAGRKTARAAPNRTSTSAAVPGSTKGGWARFTSRERYLVARQVFAEGVRGGVPARVRRDLSHGLRRFRFLPVPHRGILAQAVSARRRAHFRFAFKVPEQITCKVFPAHARYGPQARPGERRRSWTATCCRRCSCVRCCRIASRPRC